ncbi:hypothetical protein [Salibaculum halophilum]|uniref:hypothetical protein n=1 Tax=Salibaculum halophilum TaxID=1914408 RepID=UPI000A0F5687|nr:hypothetical protein [Salibaculum halophilum]
MMRLMILVLLGGLAACAPFPDLDLPADRAPVGDGPALAPLDDTLARAAALDTAARTGPDPTAALAARLTALTARAARLRQAPVIDPADRARLQRRAPALQ